MIEHFLALVVAILGPIAGWMAHKGWHQAREPDSEPDLPPKPPQDESSEPEQPETLPESESPQEAVFKAAYGLLGKHLSLNDSVPPEVGCAQALSFVLKYCGYQIPEGGISTVSGLTEWMLNSGFTPIAGYEKGAIITGRDGADAHIGICGEKWIMSNTSYTDASKELVRGAWQANFQPKNWLKVYPHTRYFLPPEVIS